ncbi:MAG TPA: hypothetical protein PL009_10985 [Flavipsychrobacter sp.]|nr:hypothetical protein [Flavipsychrobacter sp.]
MKKVILLLYAFICFSAVASAQVNAENSEATAQQAVQLGLGNALEINFSANGTNVGNTVNLNFTTANHYANGVTSSNQGISIKSNKNFSITVKAASANFSVLTNGVATTSAMSVSILGVRVYNNNTGGSLGSGFSNFKALSETAVTMISNGTKGNNKTFNVRYKATPGFNFSAGIYTVDVVYTATQL